MSLFYISEEQKILELLYKYVDAANVEKIEHEKEMDYHNKLMDLIFNHFEEYPMEWDDIFNRIQNNYHQDRKRYEELCLTLTSLELNIEMFLYTEVIESTAIPCYYL